VNCSEACGAARNRSTKSVPANFCSTGLVSSAVRTDATRGTTAIRYPLKNLADAKSAYGAIVYSKGPAVLRQAEFFEFANETVVAAPEQDVDRTTAEGKASSVQFVHFPFTPDQIAKFRAPGTRVVVGFKHPSYAHMAVMPEEVRAALAGHGIYAIATGTHLNPRYGKGGLSSPDDAVRAVRLNHLRDELAHECAVVDDQYGRELVAHPGRSK